MTEEIEKNQIAKANPADMSMGVFSSIGVYEDYRRMAADLANSDLIPEAFRKKPANVLIAVNMANRMQADPFMVMQSMYIVHGKPSFSASFVAAVIEESGKFGPLVYEMCGKPGSDNYGCRITTVIRSNNQEVQGTWVTIDMAKKEGWYGKAGSKWPNMPEQMLRYRAVSFFGRLYAGSILLGMQTKEELDDIKDINPIPGQDKPSKSDMRDSLVGDAVVIEKEVEATVGKNPEKSEVKPDLKQEDKKPDEKKGSTSDNPWTTEDLIKTIQDAEDIETVNEALSLTSGFSKVESNKVLKAAGVKNKELAAKRAK